MTPSKLAYLFAYMIFFAFLASPCVADQQDEEDDLSPEEARLVWLSDNEFALAPKPFNYDEAEQKRFGGTFGLDLSHYTFDRSRKPKCRQSSYYNLPECSCAADWKIVEKSGIKFVYMKSSDGVARDLAFSRVWDELGELHSSQGIYRGAYHFLRPGSTAEEQAEVFLNALGGKEKASAAQLSPMLDIEWATKKVRYDTSEFHFCPSNRRKKSQLNDIYICDMWYTKSANQVIEMASKWIEIVEAETKRKVTIYTNVKAWWNPVVGLAGQAILNGRAVWPSRYTTGGPVYTSSWAKEDASSKRWLMAPLPIGSSYPSEVFSIGHIWQFTESGRINPFLQCGDSKEVRDLDMNWVPVSNADFSGTYLQN